MVSPSTELAADLQRYLDDEPVHATPPSHRYRLGKFLRKRRGPVTAAAVGELASTVFIMAALFINAIIGTVHRSLVRPARNST